MAEWNRDTPWRQGHLLGQDALDALEIRYAPSPEQTLAIVASHDCDLTQTPEKEPVIELVVGRIAPDHDGSATHAKNARKLQIELDGAEKLWADFEATAKTTVDKQKLNAYQPRTDLLLSPENRTTFQVWLASRYRRSAFPDEFERRLIKQTKLAEKIAKILKPHRDLISGIFFDVDEGVEVVRDGADDTYTLDITVLYLADSAVAETAANNAAEEIEKAFKSKLFTPTNRWQHIELRFCEPVSESVLSYQQFRQLKRWRLDHMSLAQTPQHSVLAE